jgi:hypothetical protein
MIHRLHASVALVLSTTRVARSEPQPDSSPSANSLPSATLPAPADARGPAEPRFGDAGRLAVAADFDVGFGHTTHVGDFDVPRTSVTVRPAADVFVTRNLSVGGMLHFQYVATQVPVFGGYRPYNVDATTLTYGAAVRIGVNVPLGEIVSIWPRASAGIWTSKTSWVTQESLDPNVPPDVGFTEKAVWLGLYAPILIHPARHFFLGLGPDMFVDLSHTIREATRERTFLGASTIVGGWW